MAVHKNLPVEELHEAPQIAAALIADAGKVITPSTTEDGVGELRRLASTELSDGAELAKVSTSLLTNGGFPVFSFNPSIVSADLGSDQATAFEINTALSMIGFGEITPTTNDTVKLPDCSAYAQGTVFIIYNNDGTNPVLVYPPLGGNIDFAGVDVSYSLGNFSGRMFVLDDPATNLFRILSL